MPKMLFLVTFLVASVSLSYVNLASFAWTQHPDFYVAESRIFCDAKKDLLSCAKYRVLEYIVNYTDSSVISDTSLGPLRLIRVHQEDVSEERSVFDDTPRYISGDGEFSKFLKFVQRQINHFLNRQGIAISLPPGVRLMDAGSDYKAGAVEESRGKKQKATLFLQLITLFTAFKIKVLLSVALVAILVIKKVLLIGAFLLPSIIHNIKMHCKAAAIAAKSHYHYEDHGEEVHPYSSGGFGDLAGYGTGYGSSEIGGHYGGLDKGHSLFHRRH